MEHFWGKLSCEGKGKGEGGGRVEITVLLPAWLILLSHAISRMETLFLDRPFVPSSLCPLRACLSKSCNVVLSSFPLNFFQSPALEYPIQLLLPFFFFFSAMVVLIMVVVVVMVVAVA